MLVVCVGVFLQIIPHQPRCTRTRAIVSQPKNADEMTEKQRIALRSYQANERAHQNNHADKVRGAWGLAYMRRKAIDYSDPLPRLPDGETVDAEVSDMPPLLSGREQSMGDALAKIGRGRH